MTDQEIQAFLAERRVLVDAALAKIPACGPPVLNEALRYALLSPGKRLRPILCLAACEAVGAPRERALGWACAVEMVHAASLVHDDLPALDDDDWRRGQPTCHRRFGEAVAVLAGDALIALAFEMLVRHAPGAEAVGRAVAELARAAGPEGIAGGQVLDVLHEGRPDTTVEAVKETHLRKTAALMACSVVLGGLAGGADEKTCEALRQYGVHLGLAFQVVDDIRDVTRTEVELGKTPGRDAARGKATYPALCGLHRSRELAREHAREAVLALAPLGPAAEPLRAIADLVVARGD